MTGLQSHSPPSLPPPPAVVIPTLNPSAQLSACLERLALGAKRWERPLHVILADGGSDQDVQTHLRATQDLSVQVIQAPRGRGAQLAAGAEHAKTRGAAWLLFLHADSLLPTAWSQQVHRHQQTTPQSAAFFPLGFYDPADGHTPLSHRAARRVCRLANWRSHRLGLPYGDQGLLLPTALYQAVGGYDPALPLMEDVDLLRRLRQTVGLAGLCALPSPVLTSPERYQRGGWWLRPWRNLTYLSAYFLGVSPQRIAQWYQR